MVQRKVDLTTKYGFRVTIDADLAFVRARVCKSTVAIVSDTQTTL
jgi:hypothetical protein